MLGKNHGTRYHSWKYEGTEFQYFEYPVNLKQEEAYEGKYVIPTEEKHLSGPPAVKISKELRDVEGAFRNLKDALDMRPIYPRSGHRMEGHLFVATLAFLLQRVLERTLRTGGSDLSAVEALQALNSIRLVEIEHKDGSQRTEVTRGSSKVENLLK